jgi:hypothetical protein
MSINLNNALDCRAASQAINETFSFEFDFENGEQFTPDSLRNSIEKQKLTEFEQGLDSLLL